MSRSPDVISREYIERNGQMFRIDICYMKGGYSFLTGETIDRGYHLIVVPVNVASRNDGSVVAESLDIFDGYKTLLVKTNRRSKKAQTEAIKKTIEFTEPLVQKLLRSFP